MTKTDYPRKARFLICKDANSKGIEKYVTEDGKWIYLGGMWHVLGIAHRYVLEE
jgi:hypothetical protein